MKPSSRLDRLFLSQVMLFMNGIFIYRRRNFDKVARALGERTRVHHVRVSPFYLHTTYFVIQHIFTRSSSVFCVVSELMRVRMSLLNCKAVDRAATTNTHNFTSFPTKRAPTNSLSPSHGWNYLVR